MSDVRRREFIRLRWGGNVAARGPRAAADAGRRRQPRPFLELQYPGVGADWHMEPKRRPAASIAPLHSPVQAVDSIGNLPIQRLSLTLSR
jgi:hypothetical protein